MTPELTLMFLHAQQLGYGRYGIDLAAALQRQGVDVYDGLEDPTGEPGVADQTGRRFKQTNVVAWVSVPTHARGWYHGQHTVMSTMFEATVLPEAFRQSLHEFDQIIVPSHQNVELFSQYHHDVTCVPLGIDPQRWQYRKRPPVGREFRFLIGGSGARKGTDLAFEAFRKVFATWPADGPIPTLVMKNPKGEDFYGDRIEVIPGHISPEDEVALYASCHAYLQPSRGEGFGLQPLQAIAQGMPTILTAAHGHDAFAHLGLGISAEMSKAAYFMLGDAGDWWEPDFDELCDRMRWVYDHYTEACEQAEVNSRAALAEFTWDRTARRFADTVGLDRMCLPFAGGEWYRPTLKRYLVRVVRRWRADIGGFSYDFQPGVDYWEVADTKRVLFETGVLDPSCVDAGSAFDSGLTDEEIGRFGGYSASHAFCDSCGQKLGTGITRADEIEAELNMTTVAHKAIQ